MKSMQIITELLRKQGFKKEVTLHLKISDLGIDSLDLIDMIVKAEKKYHIEVADEKLITATTIADLIAIIDEAFATKEKTV